MIVDDEKPIRQWFSYILEKEKDLDIEIIGSYPNGLLAYEACLEDLPDIIFTDILMPQMNGIELIEKVKAISKNVQILILSNFDDFEYVRMGLKMGAFDYLLKAKCDDKDILNVISKMAEELDKLQVQSTVHKHDDTNHSIVNDIIKLINENYDQQVKLSFIAEKLNYNADYLSQIFKQYTGINFNSYLTEVRINKAKDFLISGMKVKDIAIKVGYANEMYFSTVFKNEVGVSPSRFARKNKISIKK